MGAPNICFLSFRAIVHFHDYERKGVHLPLIYPYLPAIMVGSVENVLFAALVI